MGGSLTGARLLCYKNLRFIKRNKMLTTLCGKQKNSNGKPFSQRGIEEHERNCINCKKDPVPRMSLRDLIGVDESDGVYWAMPGYYV